MEISTMIKQENAGTKDDIFVRNLLQTFITKYLFRVLYVHILVKRSEKLKWVIKKKENTRPI